MFVIYQLKITIALEICGQYKYHDNTEFTLQGK